MSQESLKDLFESFLTKESVFKNKATLGIKFSPKNIPHRFEEMKQLATIIMTSLRGDKPSNVFLYGKPGTGKSLVTSHVTSQLVETAVKKGKPVKCLYINCKLKRVADTEYRLIAQLARGLGKTVPATGLPTNSVYKIFYEAVDEEECVVILILDEIDNLVKKCGDDILYSLTRINEELAKATLAIIGISNDLTFLGGRDPRVRSSLSEREIFFPPYDALQLGDILKGRADIAFNEGAISPTVIRKCAACAAREHGDARKALDTLRVSGEIAERLGDEVVKEIHVDMAQEKIETDRFEEAVKSLPQQLKLVLKSVVWVLESRKPPIITGEVFEVYNGFCVKYGTKSLTKRRVSDLITELDMLGILNTKVVSFGKKGRTKEISLAIPDDSMLNIKKILKDELVI